MCKGENDISPRTDNVIYNRFLALSSDGINCLQLTETSRISLIRDRGLGPSPDPFTKAAAQCVVRLYSQRVTEKVA